MVKQTDITKCKIEFLKQFDYYVKNVLDNEDITAVWLKIGVSDVTNEELLKNIASDYNLWLTCVTVFAECCEWAGVI